MIERIILQLVNHYDQLLVHYIQNRSDHGEKSFANLVYEWSAEKSSTLTTSDVLACVEML